MKARREQSTVSTEGAVAIRNWLKEYDRAVQADLEAGRLKAAGDAEQRRHPRLKVPGVAVWVGVESGVHLISLGAKRARLYSRARLEPGRRLTLRLDEAAELELEVRGCKLERPDPAALEVFYRVEAKVLATPQSERAHS